ncbi:uncharacterized protein [Argopecten irradians]|uniref:uncharacterized protein n=1 Tax=Argopecten irradians TaxID=31199 RepID=UPI0037242DD8
MRARRTRRDINPLYLTPVLTEESTIRLLCEPLQLLLKENNIKVNVKFNDGNHPVGHEWFAYCCSDREEADIQTLQKYRETKRLVLFFRKEETEMDTNNCLSVIYYREDDGYKAKLMRYKKDSNDKFLKSVVYETKFIA